MVNSETAILTFQIDALAQTLDLSDRTFLLYCYFPGKPGDVKFPEHKSYVNSKEIYPLLSDELIVIPVNNDHPKIVVTDGFHFTKPLELVYHEPSYYHCKSFVLLMIFSCLEGFSC